MVEVKWVFVILVFEYSLVNSIFLVVPEDVPSALVGIYGFAPKLVAGKDSRFGFGFRLGNHADFQVVYELGPQKVTRPLAKPRARSVVSYRQRTIRRRPLLRLLLRAGLLEDASYNYHVVHGEEIDLEPR